jgi:large subunit ribosomal protein L1
VGASEYRERLGVIRMAVGQLGFTPEEMQKNVKTFMDALKKDLAQMSDRISKEIHEVVSHPNFFGGWHILTQSQVLSSTNAPGFTLNGDFRGNNSIPAKDLSGPL